MSDTPFTNNSEDVAGIHARIRQDRDTAIIEEGFKWSDLKLFRAYANGKHNVTLTNKQREILEHMLGNKFCDNVCKQIVQESTGRITFKGWKCKNENVKKWLDTFYRLARIQNRQADVHWRSLRDGNFVLAVNWDPKRQRVQVYKENWWDGESGVYIHYDESDEPEYAVKQWSSFQRIQGTNGYSSVRVFYRTVWFEDRIERYKSTDNSSDLGWQKNPLDTDLIPNDEKGEGIPENIQSWPMPWVDDKGDPLGIPYVHFPNAGSTYGNYGVSELDGGILGFQDQLNDAQYNLSINVRFTGGQMYYATGVKLENDATTSKPKAIQVEPGMFHTSANEKSTFGVLTAGDPDSIIKSYNVKLKAVSRIAAVPLHSITGGDWPSGDALLRAELPAVSKALKQIGQYQDCWITVATLAMKIHNVFKKANEPAINYDIEDGIIEAEFADPEKRDAISRSIIVHNLTDKIGVREALRIMDYSEERAQDIYDEKVEEDNDTAEALASTIATRGLGGTATPRKEAGNSGGNNKPDARPA